MTNADLTEFIEPLRGLFKPDEKIDNQKVLEQVAQINMQIMVKFPKDKDEILKKKMAALMKKMKASENITSDDFSGENGEIRLLQINNQLTQFYDD